MRDFESYLEIIKKKLFKNNQRIKFYCHFGELFNIDEFRVSDTIAKKSV